MKWYGFYNYPLNYVFNNKSRFNEKQNKLAKKLWNRVNLNSYKIFLHMPFPWDAILFKVKKNASLVNLYMYTPVYFFFFTFPITFSNFKYNTNTKCLCLEFFLVNNYFRLFWNYFKIVFSSFSKVFFRKLKFKGKGYYIYKNIRNTIALQFGYSHKVNLYCFFISVRFLTKTSIFMFSINRGNVWNRSNALFRIRPINIFTGKGMRFSRQIIYRKTGKISSYR